MATHIHELWSKAGGAPEHACYLADRKGALIFDSGLEAPVFEECALDLKTLARLNGIASINAKDCAFRTTFGATEEHIDSITTAICGIPSPDIRAWL